MPGALRAPGGWGARGRWGGHRYTVQGRRHVRRALYLAAPSAMRANSALARLVQRLRKRSKAGKAIAIALARKLLTIAAAVIRDGKPFRLA